MCSLYFNDGYTWIIKALNSVKFSRFSKLFRRWKYYQITICIVIWLWSMPCHTCSKLLQFVSVMHARTIDCLLDDASCLAVERIEVEAFRWPQIRPYDSRCCLLETLYSVVCHVCNRTAPQHGIAAICLKCGWK